MNKRSLVTKIIQKGMHIIKKAWGGKRTCSVAGGCVGTEPKLFCVVPFVIADELLIGVVINGVECVVLAIGGMVDGAKPLDNVTNGLACCDCVCEC